jgi:glucokinase
METVYAGVDIGGTKTAVLLSANPPETIWREEFPTSPQDGPGHALESIVSNLRRALDATGFDARSLRGIGVSCGSPLDPEKGVIKAPPNLPTWVDVPIKRLLETQFGAPCRLENDANAGALAEFKFGAGQGARNMLFLTMGTGLGAGIIINGQLYAGTSGSAGEIGHVRLTRTGPVGYHKAGSVEGWASGGGMAQVAARTVERAVKRGEDTLLAVCLSSNGGISARDVGEAVNRGDKLALQIVRATGRRLGETLAILVDILNPERIVIGGLAMRLGAHHLDEARSVLKREALPQSAACCTVVPAALGEKIGDVAALCVAMSV